MHDHDPGIAHPSLIDLNMRRAQRIAEQRAAEPIQLHCRRPRWEPVTVSDPNAALATSISMARSIDEPPRGATVPVDMAATVDMSRGIGKALEDAEQQGYVRGHADGLVAAVQCERLDWIAVGFISGLLAGLVVHAAPSLLDGLDYAFRWLL